MSRSREVQAWVEVDLSDFDVDDLVEELEARKRPLPADPKTTIELHVIKQRFFEQRRRAATVDPSSVTFEEREFWHHQHDLDL